MIKRKAFVLTGDISSERYIFSKTVLENIGFDVHHVIYILDNDKILSNRMSMQSIYELIANSEDEEFRYVFEDDINIIEPITLDEIVQYEKISEMFFI